MDGHLFIYIFFFSEVWAGLFTVAFFSLSQNRTLALACALLAFPT